MRGLHLCIGALSVALATATANAEKVTSVNVNFRQPSGNINVTGAWDSTVSPLPYASQPVTPVAWTNTDRLASDTPGDVLVLNDSMDQPTGLNYTISGFTQDQTDTWSGLNLLKSGFWATAPMTLAVGGLATDGTTYDLYIACAEGNAAFPMSLSVAGDPTAQSTIAPIRTTRHSLRVISRLVPRFTPKPPQDRLPTEPQGSWRRQDSPW